MVTESPRISDEQLVELKENLLGTCQTLTAGIEAVGLEDFPIEHVEDRLLDDPGGGAVELCPACEWWFHSHDLNEAESGRCVCDQCLEDENAEG